MEHTHFTKASFEDFYPWFYATRGNRHIVPTGVWRELQPIYCAQTNLLYIMFFLVQRDLEHEEDGREVSIGANEQQRVDCGKVGGRRAIVVVNLELGPFV